MKGAGTSGSLVSEAALTLTPGLVCVCPETSAVW